MIFVLIVKKGLIGRSHAESKWSVIYLSETIVAGRGGGNWGLFLSNLI